jgi:hypothetical protein
VTNPTKKQQHPIKLVVAVLKLFISIFYTAALRKFPLPSYTVSYIHRGIRVFPSQDN